MSYLPIPQLSILLLYTCIGILKNIHPWITDRTGKPSLLHHCLQYFMSTLRLQVHQVQLDAAAVACELINYVQVLPWFYTNSFNSIVEIILKRKYFFNFSDTKATLQILMYVCLSLCLSPKPLTHLKINHFTLH